MYCFAGAVGNHPWDAMWLLLAWLRYGHVQPAAEAAGTHCAEDGECTEW